MYAGKKFHILESKAFAASGNVQIPVTGFDRLRRILGFNLVFDSVPTTDGAADGCTVTQLVRLIKNVSIGDRVLMTGLALRFLNWQMRGHDILGQLAGVPVTNSKPFQRPLEIFVPYADEGAFSPGDTATCPEFYANTPITIEFDALSVLGDHVASAAGTVSATAVHAPIDFGVVPSVVEMKVVDITNTKRIQIDGERVFTHLGIYKETGAAITSAEIINLLITADGDPQMKPLPMRSQDLVRYFNRDCARGSALGVASATVPVGGEFVTCLPSVAADATAAVSMEFIPALWSPPRQKLSKSLHVQRELIIDTTGTLSTFKVFYRAIVPRNDQMREGMRAALGIPAGKQFVVKTGTKTANKSQRLARILPLKYQVA